MNFKHFDKFGGKLVNETAFTAHVFFLFFLFFIFIFCPVPNV